MKALVTIKYLDGSKTSHTFSNYPEGAEGLGKMGEQSYITIKDDEKKYIFLAPQVKSIVIKEVEEALVSHIHESTNKDSATSISISAEGITCSVLPSHVHSVVSSTQSKNGELEKQVENLSEKFLGFHEFTLEQIGELRKRARDLEAFKSGIEARRAKIKEVLAVAATFVLLTSSGFGIIVLLSKLFS